MGLFIDLFAGGGGASNGIEAALGRPIDIAVNHDPMAIAMHMANHPSTTHHIEDIWSVDPVEATGGQRVSGLWASPDCKHHSRAKGGKPVSKKIRGLPWSIVKWAAQTRTDTIFSENVPEMQTWGPLIAKRDPKTGRVLKIAEPGTGDEKTKPKYEVAEPGEVVPLHRQYLIPDPKRKGETFRKFINALRKLGYVVEWRELVACDHGAPTTRTRWYMIARCDGIPITWPEPTHGKGRKPYRTAAECIDWSIPVPSIFDRKKPLAENTLKRIATGVVRFTIDSPDPFVIHLDGDGAFAPFITKFHSGSTGQRIDEPIHTITAGSVGASNHPGATAPFGIVTANLLTYYGNKNPDDFRGQDLRRPIATQTTENRHALVTAFLAKHYTGVVGSKVDAPIGTITGWDHHSLVTCHLQRQFGQSVGQKVNSPVGAIMPGGGGKTALVAAFLSKYYGTNIGQHLYSPIQTITSKDRFGLVLVWIDGVSYVITDIGMRMLQPHELYLAQGFPAHYLINLMYNGRRLSKAAQVRMCGNSVCPPVAEALVRANVGEAFAKAA